MSAKDKMVKAVAARKGVAPSNKEQKKHLPKDALSYTEMRHYEPEFSAADPKWLVLGRMHVQVCLNTFIDLNHFHCQKAGPRVALASILIAILLALAGFLLLHPLPFMFSWLLICCILLAVSLIALAGTIRAVPALLLPYLFAVWVLTVISFACFFLFAPMAMTMPTFWNHWVTAAFGIAEQEDAGERGSKWMLHSQYSILSNYFPPILSCSSDHNYCHSVGIRFPLSVQLPQLHNAPCPQLHDRKKCCQKERPCGWEYSSAKGKINEQQKSWRQTYQSAGDCSLRHLASE